MALLGGNRRGIGIDVGRRRRGGRSLHHLDRVVDVGELLLNPVELRGQIGHRIAHVGNIVVGVVDFGGEPGDRPQAPLSARDPASA